MTDLYGIEFAGSPAEYVVDTAWNLALVFVGATAGIHLFARKLLADACEVTLFGTLAGPCQAMVQTGQEYSFYAALAGAAMFVTWGAATALGGDT